MTTKDEYATITKYDLLYEQRMTKVETSLENLEKNIRDNFAELKNENREIRKQMSSDFRWLILLMIALLGVMAKGFEWI